MADASLTVIATVLSVHGCPLVPVPHIELARLLECTESVLLRHGHSLPAGNVDAVAVGDRSARQVKRLFALSRLAICRVPAALRARARGEPRCSSGRSLALFGCCGAEGDC